MIKGLPGPEDGLLPALHRQRVGEELGLQADGVPGSVRSPALARFSEDIVSGVHLHPGKIRGRRHGDAGIRAAEPGEFLHCSTVAQYIVVVISAGQFQLRILLRAISVIPHPRRSIDPIR